MLIGRVTETKGLIGKAEFTQQAQIGDLIYYRAPNNQKVTCQIVNLKTTPIKGFSGDFKILDNGPLPKTYAELYLLLPSLDNGQLELGTSTRGQMVKLSVNPMFRHVLVVGMTGAGKTHTLIVIEEELLKLHVPSLVLDTHGELIHLNEYSPDVIVTEELRIEDLIGYLKHKKTVVYNLQGLPKTVKANRVFELLSQLYELKEKDYKRAENDARLLKIPPVMILIDEAEIYAPEYDNQASDPRCKQALTSMAEEGSKYGIGLIVVVQRPPRLELEVRSQCNSAIIFHVYDDGSRKVLRALPFISSTELNRVKNCGQGTCLITGLLVQHPIMVNVREISTRRAKNVNYEEILGIKQSKHAADPEPEQDQTAELSLPSFEETSPGKPLLQVTNKGAAVEVDVRCPECNKPLARERNKLVCKTQNCSFMYYENGVAHRSALSPRVKA